MTHNYPSARIGKEEENSPEDDLKWYHVLFRVIGFLSTLVLIIYILGVMM